MGNISNESPEYTPSFISGRIMVPLDCAENQNDNCTVKSNREVSYKWVPVEDVIVTAILCATLIDKIW